MPAEVFCSSCEYHFHVDSKHRGKTIRCPSCSEPVRVSGGPARASAPRDSSRRRSTPPRRSSAARSVPRRSSSSRRRSRATAPNTMLVAGGGFLLGLALFAVVGYVVFQSRSGGSTDVAATADTDRSADRSAKRSAPTPPKPVAITALSRGTPDSIPVPDSREVHPGPGSATPGGGAAGAGGTIGSLFSGKSPMEAVAARTRALPSAAEAANDSNDTEESGDDSEIEFTSWADLTDRVEPSVVRINVKSSAGSSIGSGFVVDTSGVIVTNYHVIAGAEKATVVFANGDEMPATGFLHLNHNKDIALLQIDPAAASTPLRALTLFIGEPRKGSEVAAYGAPQGLPFSFSKGTVSAYREAKRLHDSVGFPREEGYWVQHSVPISPGSSGGPLVNRSGQVIAINTVTLTSGQALNFGISSNDISEANASRTSLVAISPSAAPDHDTVRTASAGSPGEGTGDHPYFSREATLADETKTEKGRKLLAEMKVMNFVMLALEFDPRRTVSGAVQEKLRNQLKSSDVDYDLLADDPVMLIIMTLEPLGNKHALWLRTILVAEDSGGIPCRIWENREDLGYISQSSLFRGSLPRKLDRSIDSYFRKLRTDITSARRELAIEAAQGGTSDGESESGSESDAESEPER